MYKEYKFCIDPKDSGKRLDRFLADQLTDVSRSDIDGYNKSGKVTVNDLKQKKSYRLQANDLIFIKIPLEDIELLPDKKELKILYEDNYFLVVHKEAGVVVHPNPHDRRNTLVNYLLYLDIPLSNIGGRERPGIVHRLDKDTSGLIIIAKDNQTHLIFKELFKKRKIVKKYYAVAEGVLPNHGSIDLPIARDPVNPTKMAVVKNGRQALTLYKNIGHNTQYSLVDINLITGRTHQIRVHLSSLGFPLLGDTTYGGKKQKVIDIPHYFLHSYSLIFQHPYSGSEISITDPMPEYMINFLIKEGINF